MKQSPEILRGLSRSEWETVLHFLRWSDDDDLAEPSPAYRKWMTANAHCHEFIEILVGLRGLHSYGIGEKALHLGPGVAAVIPRSVLHDAIYGKHHSECVDFWLHLFPSGAVTLNFVHHSPRAETISLPVSRPAMALVEDFRRAGRLLYQASAPLEQRKTGHFLLFLLHELFALLMETNLSSQEVDEQSVIEAVKRYVAGHLTDRLALNDLAKAAGYSPFHFHRIFLEAEGITPRLFVEGRRLKLACDLLKKGHTVTSAALDSGFATASQFNRVFKKQFRSSPSEWMKAAK